MATVITESLVYAPTVTAPDDADALNAASVVAPGVGFQALTNRTNNLVARVGGDSGAGEHEYVDAAGAAQVRTRTRIIGALELDTHAAQIATGAQGWYAQLGRNATSIANFPRLTIDLNKYIPDGAFVGLIRCIIAPGLARPVNGGVPGDNGRMNSFLFRMTPNFGAPAVPAFGANIAHVEDDGTVNVQNLTNAMNQIVSKGASVLYWQLVGGNDAATNRDDVYAVEITYSDPGPQNF